MQAKTKLRFSPARFKKKEKEVRISIIKHLKKNNYSLSRTHTHTQRWMGAKGRSEREREEEAFFCYFQPSAAWVRDVLDPRTDELASGQYENLSKKPGGSTSSLMLWRWGAGSGGVSSTDSPVNSDSK